MRLNRAWMGVSVLALGMLLAAGCHLLVLGAAGAAGGYTYAKGKLTQLEEVSLDSAYQASLAAVEELKLKPRKKTVDAMVGVVEASTADNKTAAINLVKKTDTSTEINIRVGTGMLTSEKDRAVLIMDTIKKHLPAA